MAEPRPAPRQAPPEQDPRMARLNRLSYLLDNAIRIPGINYRIGYDALIGLIPGIGDVAGVAISAFIVFEASRFGLPKTTLARMVVNVAIEALVGTIPVLGDLFDATWKANARNMRLVHRHLGPERARQRKADRWYLLVVLGLLLLVVVVLIVLVYLIAYALVEAFGG